MENPGSETNRELIEQVARQLSRWRLTLPAILFLEVTRPLSFLASQGLLLCQPLLGFFYDEPRIAGYAELLSDRENIDRLVARLERDKLTDGNNGKEKGR